MGGSPSGGHRTGYATNFGEPPASMSSVLGQLVVAILKPLISKFVEHKRELFAHENLVRLLLLPLLFLLALIFVLLAFLLLLFISLLLVIIFLPVFLLLALLLILLIFLPLLVLQQRLR